MIEHRVLINAENYLEHFFFVLLFEGGHTKKCSGGYF